MMKGSKLIMKTMKKMFALALALMLVFSLALTANAAEVTIQNAQVGKLYTVYQLLDEHTQNANGGIVYKSTEAWKDFWTQKSITVGESVVDITKYFTLKTEGENLIVIPNNFSESDAAIVAKAAAAYATTNNIAAVGTANGEATTKIALSTGDGYYLMTSSTGDLCTLAHIEEGGNMVLREKNTPSGLPDIEKEIGDNGTGYKVGEIFNSTIKVTCDEGKTKYTVVDTMTGLELVSAAAEFKVKYNGQEITPTITIYENKNGFEIEMEFAAPTKAYDEITIEYTVKVTEAGVNEITNKAELKEDPTVFDEDQANNGGFALVKQNESNAPLGGAKFKLYSDPECTNEVQLYNAGDYYRPVIGQEQAVAITAGNATIKGLAAGTYFLKEIEAPAGYVIDDTVHTVNIDLEAVTPVTITVTNVKGEELPETGGMGTTLFYTVGGLMAAASVILLVSKKRMSAM